MMYWDNAATTYPKPLAVRQAVADALTRYGANPGRGGYPMSIQTAEMVFDCRVRTARLFGLSDPTAVLFFPSCTAALNTVLRGLLQNGGRAVISDLEHNAVVRPLHALSPSRPVYDVARVEAGDAEQTVRNFAAAIRPDTKVICCTCASNVFGLRPPIGRIGALAAQAGIPFAVDGAQGGGLIDLDMEKNSIDYLCLPGHKGLYGPMGIGLLLCRRPPAFPPLLQGGTGTRSLSPEQPDEAPEGYESGTLNVSGIAGLRQGVGFVTQRDIDALYRTESALMRQLYDGLSRVRGVTLYTPAPTDEYVPLLSLNLGEMPSEAAARLLAQNGMAVRAGLHCAPLAHQKYQTVRHGTVRLCPGAFTDRGQMQKAYKIIAECAAKALHSL